MANECLNNGCNNERMDARGGLGRFCSEECMLTHNTEPDSAVVEGLSKAVSEL